MGVIGVLVAIPATATLQGFVGAYVRRYEVEEVGAGCGPEGRAGYCGEASLEAGRVRCLGGARPRWPLCGGTWG